MNVSCRDRERILLDGTAEEWAALAQHCARCATCAVELRAWTDLSAAASELHQEWDSAELWPRISAALERQGPTEASGWKGLLRSWNPRILHWQIAAAAVLVLALTGSAIWFMGSRHQGGVRDDQALLDNRAVDDVERAEAAYERAIDKLDAQAQPQLRNSSTPLMANYREKLLVLDSAIADLRAQAGINPGNGHVRHELLAMYREKQDTLEQVLQAKK